MQKGTWKKNHWLCTWRTLYDCCSSIVIVANVLHLLSGIFFFLNKKETVHVWLCAKHKKNTSDKDYLHLVVLDMKREDCDAAITCSMWPTGKCNAERIFVSMTASDLNEVLLRIFNNANIDSFILQGHGSPLCQSQGSIKESRLNALAFKRQSERDSLQETLHSESQPKPEDQFVWNQSEDHHYQVPRNRCSQEMHTHRIQWGDDTECKHRREWS